MVAPAKEGGGRRPCSLTFGDGVLDLGTLDDDVVVVEVLILLDEVVAVAVLAAARGGRGRGELHPRHEHPLHDGEGNADDTGDGDAYRKQSNPRLARG